MKTLFVVVLCLVVAANSQSPLTKRACRSNEELVDCPAICDPTCKGSPPIGCQETPCDGKFCKCLKGLVRFNKKCISPKKCPGKCKGRPNEEFRYDACEGICSDPEATRDCFMLPHRFDCFCKPMYIRNDNKVCVLPEDCYAPTCPGPNEELRFGTCDVTCHDPSLYHCNEPLTKKCFCKANYARFDGGVCKPLWMCGDAPPPDPRLQQ